MAWCHHTTSHYLSQCWPRSMSPCSITGPQWVEYLPNSFISIGPDTGEDYDVFLSSLETVDGINLNVQIPECEDNQNIGLWFPIKPKKYLIISWYLHVWNGVAVAAYSRLASRSQAKFHTKKLSPLVRPCAAAPAQSTTSAYRSLDFRRATSSQRGRWVGSWPLLLRSIHEDTS